VKFLAEGHAGEAGSRLVKGIPIGRAPSIDLRNAHLSYVITWYVFLNNLLDGIDSQLYQVHSVHSHFLHVHPRP
jgi:hypothetical protein